MKASWFNMLSCVLLFLIIHLNVVHSYAQSIILDNEYYDWSTSSPSIYEDSENDNIEPLVDFLKFGLASNSDYLFVYFEMDKEINLQENNNISIYIDVDNNTNTGQPINGIGADLQYYFGERYGKFTKNGVSINISHKDIGLMVLPTVSSNKFELVIDRNAIISGQQILPESKIKVLFIDDRSNGDRMPDANGGILYEMNDTVVDLSDYRIQAPSESDFRVLSYNVLRDDMFNFEKQESYKSIFRMIKPDIIGFQEIYDHSAKQTKDKFLEQLGDSSGQWYYKKSDPDIICVSRYPIFKSEAIDGNAAFWIKKDDENIVFIVAHLPCCSNDYGRQREIDHVMSFVREIKEGISNWDIPANSPIIIVGDMNMVGDSHQSLTLKTGDIKNENLFGSDFHPDWDESDFEDAKPIATGIPSTITWYDQYSSFNPGRLDYIVYSGSVLELNNSFSLFTPRLAQDTLSKYELANYDSVWASDHMPCVADFRLKKYNSVEELNDYGKINLSPNPVMNELLIEIEEDLVGKTQISVLNSFGQLVYFKSLNLGSLKQNSLILNTSQFSNGVYFLQMELNGSKFHTKKIVVQH